MTLTATAVPEVETPTAIRVFGREPAVFLGLAEATLALFVVLAGAPLGLDANFTVVALAVVSAGVGLYSAWATEETLLGVGTGLTKALIGLSLYFGLDLSLETQATVVAFTAAAIGFWQRTQTSPVVDRAAFLDYIAGSPIEYVPTATVTFDPTRPQTDEDGDG